MQLSGGEVIQCVSTNHKCAVGLNSIRYYKLNKTHKEQNHVGFFM